MIRGESLAAGDVVVNKNGITTIRITHVDEAGAHGVHVDDQFSGARGLFPTGQDRPEWSVLTEK